MSRCGSISPSIHSQRCSVSPILLNQTIEHYSTPVVENMVRYFELFVINKGFCKIRFFGCTFYSQINIQSQALKLKVYRNDLEFFVWNDAGIFSDCC